MMLRVIILKGLSQYGALRLFADEMHKAYRQLKVDSVLIDLDSKDCIDRLEKQLNIGCSFVMAFNGVGSDLKVQNDSLYNVMNIPYVGIYVDHPRYHLERLSNDIRKYIVTVVDRKHIDFLTDYFPQNTFLCRSFLPHGGIANNKTFNEKGFSVRSDNILFSGTYKGIPEKKWVSFDNCFLRQFINDVYEARSEFMSIENAVDYVAKYRSIYIQESLWKKIKLHTVQLIDDYDKSQIRREILQYVLNNGYSVDIYGNGTWSEIANNYSNAHYKGNIEMSDLIKLYSQYKVTLNDNNNFRNGSHERVFNALANGCQCITTYSSYYDDIFKNHKGLIYYSRSDFNNLNNLIDIALREAAYDKIAMSREYVLENHLWKNRAEEILALYEMTLL